jgi:excisionase family DNA binding protein
MAKMYYNEQEAAEQLGVDVDGLNELVSNGTLRAYQDGQKRMFKASDVDEIAGDSGAGGGEEIELTPVSSGDTGDAIALSAADSVAEGDSKEDTVITAEGISIFDDEDLEIEDADPMAKTQIAPSLEDQIALDGVGSGSGLLDLTRESDNTSLGEVLDNIDVDSVVGEEPEESQAYVPPAQGQPEAPRTVEAPDPSAGLFGGLALAAALAMLLTGVVGVMVIGNVVPGLLVSIRENVTIVVAALAGIALIAAIAGFFIGKSAADKQAAMGRMRG